MSKLSLTRTLGPLVIDWIEQNLVHGPGDVQGDKIVHDDEETLFIMRCYEIDAKGRRVVRRAMLSRPKGRRKSEIAAELVCAEALGPVRFAGWDDRGRPLGMPVKAPLIRCAATEEDQADNTYAKVEFMLREGPVSKTKGLDVGQTRTFLPDRGKIVPITARASSKDGGLESFAVFDETHLYVTPELRRLFQTVRRNLGKRKLAEPWSLETSTMYAPGEESIAESAHLYYEKIKAGKLKDPGFLFDHKQGPTEFDFEDDEQLRAALVQAYGPASEWMDIERLISDSRDPDSDRSDFLRYFVNIPIERTQGKWIQDEAWRARMEGLTIPEGGAIQVGVDAAHTRDTSACVWSYFDPDKDRIVQRSRVWSCVERKPHDVFVPGGKLDNDLIRDYILETLAKRYTVTLVGGDGHYFDDQLQEIAEAGIVVIEMTPSSNDMLDAWDDFYAYVMGGNTLLSVPALEDEGGLTYAQHVRNCLGVRTERGWKVSKKGSQPNDAPAAGAVSGWLCRHSEELLSQTGGGMVYA